MMAPIPRLNVKKAWPMAMRTALASRADQFKSNMKSQPWANPSEVTA